MAELQENSVKLQLRGATETGAEPSVLDGAQAGRPSNTADGDLNEFD